MRLSIRRLSIRWRLTFWNTLALAVVLIGFAALIYALSARALYQQTDQRLRAALERVKNDPRMENDRNGRLRYWAFELHEHENIFCVVYDRGGAVRTGRRPSRRRPSARSRAPSYSKRVRQPLVPEPSAVRRRSLRRP